MKFKTALLCSLFLTLPSQLTYASCNKECLLLASIVEAEAGAASKLDKIAVAYTVVNRIEATEKHSVRSVVRAKRQYAKPKKAEDDSKEIALAVLKKRVKDPTKGATHFHNKTVKPVWGKKMKRTLVTTHHIYMKEKAE